MTTFILHNQVYLDSLILLTLSVLALVTYLSLKKLTKRTYQQYKELNALHDEVRQLLHADVGLGKRLAEIEKTI